MKHSLEVPTLKCRTYMCRTLAGDVKVSCPCVFFFLSHRFGSKGCASGACLMLSFRWFPTTQPPLQEEK